ncbi:hypothetical protein HUG17_10239 [Dermatophagoides farinae]|uniref:Uncharacterized protein n=1 Tax=Dermatophagoides farinae TaxID=6954 RepID=A0A9D4NPI2_DERFA|nr:hypothetical protein HUG17_10239 [Dermatophagoides farinae]
MVPLSSFTSFKSSKCKFHSTMIIILFSWLLFGALSSLDPMDIGNNRYFGKYVGSFDRDWNNNHHRHHNIIVAGDVYFVNKHTLFLYNFSFDGQESDVYFKVGGYNIGHNGGHGSEGIILPDELGRFHQLGRYQNQNILLTLPKGISVDKIRLISLWSKRLLKNLAEIRIFKSIAIPEMKNLGPLMDTKDLVKAKTVMAVDDKTILIRKLYYSIECLRCGFFVGHGTIPNFYGIKIPDEHASFSKLRNYYNEDIILRLPRDISLNNIDWFAIYDPENNKNYGYIRINNKDLNIPPSMAFMLTYVTLFSNCESILPGLMHVSWEIRHPDIYIQLEARIASNQYAAFGLSGSLKQSKMIGSDIFVTYYDADSNKVVLEDFTVTAKTQCNIQTGIGVCPDTVVGGNNNLELLMSSYIDGLIKVTFRRTISVMGDHQNDLPFLVHDPNPIVAAIGTLDTHKNPSYHTVAVNTKYHQSKYRPMTVVNFGLINEPANIFNTIANSQLSETEIIYELRPWKPAIIKTNNNHVFHVVIGPAGNAQQGYTSITGQESPGIAFWINDLLIPELHVVRGHDYTFLIETGDNRTDRKHYHPFYITDSREGGNPNNFSVNHHIYAGVKFHDDIVDPKPGTGRYCELIESSRVDPSFIYSIEDYRKTLRLYCGVCFV